MNTEQVIKIYAEAGKKAYILVGPPSVGKSTWVAENAPNAHVINRDDLVTATAASITKELNLPESDKFSYDDMFTLPPVTADMNYRHPKYGPVEPTPEYMFAFLKPEQKFIYSSVKKANDRVFQQLKERYETAQGNETIVVDMTMMDKRARGEALKNLGLDREEYRITAVYFSFEGVKDIIKKIAHVRSEIIKKGGGSKTIPPHVFDDMFKKYEHPSTSEGFHNVVSADETIKNDDERRAKYMEILKTLEQELALL